MSNIYDSIIKSGLLDPIQKPKLPNISLCTITEKDKLLNNIIDKIPSSVLELNEIHDLLDLPQINQESDIIEVINKIEEIYEYKNQESQNIKDKLNAFNNFSEEEEELDIMEIKLSKLKMEYNFLEKMNECGINELKNQIQVLSKENLDIPHNKIIKIKTFLLLLQSEMTMENEIELKQFILSNKDILNYFDFILKENNLIENIIEEENLLEEIGEKMPESLEKNILIMIIKEKEIYIPHLCNVLGKEKYEIMGILQDLEFNGVINLHRVTENISLKLKNM